MKGIFSIGIFIAATMYLIAGYLACNEPKQSNLDVLQAQYDSIMQENARLDVLLDSVKLEIIKSDSIIIHTKETIYVKVKSIFNLNADNTISLFNSNVRQLQDSLNQKGYIFNLPN